MGNLFSGQLGVSPFSQTIGDTWSYGSHLHVDMEHDLIKDNLDELRNTVANHASRQMDYQVLEQIRAQLIDGVNPPEKTPEEKVIDIVKGGFEKKFGISIQEFQEIYDNLVVNSPEKLI